MWEGLPPADEVKQNIHDQMHPTQPFPYVPPAVESVDSVSSVLGLQQPVSVQADPRLLGLTKRQIDLIHNKDDIQPQTGAARERRLQIIHRDIDAINKFLPRLEDVRTYLTTMPTNDEEDLIEALAMADNRLKHFIGEVNRKLESLQMELDLKKVVV